jgi:hypothetical protein
MKKKHYMKPEQRVVVLQHRTMLLQASRVESLSTSGLDQEDVINTSEEGGGSSIWDR